MKICIVAYETKTDITAELCAEFCGALCRHQVFVTGSASKYIEERAGFAMGTLLSVSDGGVEQITQLVACRDADMVICLRDALPDRPERREVTELIRTCDFYNVPIATGLATARIILSALSRKNTADMFSRK